MHGSFDYGRDSLFETLSGEGKANGDSDPDVSWIRIVRSECNREAASERISATSSAPV
jgi:hypothetical protein